MFRTIIFSPWCFNGYRRLYSRTKIKEHLLCAQTATKKKNKNCACLNDDPQPTANCLKDLVIRPLANSCWQKADWRKRKNLHAGRKGSAGTCHDSAFSPRGIEAQPPPPTFPFILLKVSPFCFLFFFPFYPFIAPTLFSPLLHFLNLLKGQAAARDGRPGNSDGLISLKKALDPSPSWSCKENILHTRFIENFPALRMLSCPDFPRPWIKFWHSYQFEMRAATGYLGGAPEPGNSVVWLPGL
jgi:hypothetical protein